MEIDPAKTYDWQCNRCNLVRKLGVGRCPNCGCSEFRLVEVETVYVQAELPGM